MIDTEKLKFKTNLLEKTNQEIEVLENLDSAHFKAGNTLQITIESSLYGTLSHDKITTYQSAKKHITPVLQMYKEKRDMLLLEIQEIVKAGETVEQN